MSKTITITKTINAPAKRVFDAYISSEDLMKWYSAGDGWTIPYAEVDAKPGGKFKIGFQDPKGKDSFDFTGTYSEVVPSRKIAYKLDDGRRATITFTEKDSKTELTVTFEMENINSEELQRKGWTAQLDHLEEYLNNEKPKLPNV